MLLLLVGIVLFLAVHLFRVLAPGLREAMIDRMGAATFRVVYSVSSLATLALLVYGYANATAARSVNLYFPPVGMAHLSVTLMLFAMICLAASLVPAGYIARAAKHPMVLSVKIWALAHLLANGDLASVVLFSSFLAWGVILRIALKRRERAGLIAIRPFVSGRYDLMAVVIGVIVWAAFLLKLHSLLIGVAPIPALDL